MDNKETMTYEAAVKGDDFIKWKEAMQEELAALRKNETWKLVKLSQNVKILDNKWVLKIKLNSNEKVDKYKARLMARGFKQEEG